MDEEDCAWLRLVDRVVCEIWKGVRHFASSDQERTPWFWDPTRDLEKELEPQEQRPFIIKECSVFSWLLRI
jgi:hypothetical protein